MLLTLAYRSPCLSSLSLAGRSNFDGLGALGLPFGHQVFVLFWAPTVLTAGVFQVLGLASATTPLEHACGSLHTVFFAQTLEPRPKGFAV